MTETILLAIYSFLKELSYGVFIIQEYCSNIEGALCGDRELWSLFIELGTIPLLILLKKTWIFEIEILNSAATVE
jgi:hypothetical protein